MEYFDDKVYYKTVCCDQCGLELYHLAKRYDKMLFCDNKCLINMLNSLGSIDDVYIRASEPEI